MEILMSYLTKDEKEIETEKRNTTDVNSQERKARKTKEKRLDGRGRRVKVERSGGKGEYDIKTYQSYRGKRISYHLTNLQLSQ